MEIKINQDELIKSYEKTLKHLKNELDETYEDLEKTQEELDELRVKNICFSIKEIDKDTTNKIILKFAESILKISKHEDLSCTETCDYCSEKHSCSDEISNYGKNCPVGLAKQVLKDIQNLLH